MSHLGTGMFQQSRRLASTRKHVMVLAILVIGMVLGVASQTVLATSHNQPINGCYDTSSGVLRYIGSGMCRTNEVALSWPSMDDFVSLQGALAQETAEREAAVSALEASIAALQTSIDEEVAALQQVDAALGTTLANETATREASDAALQTALDNAVAAQQAALATETAARVDGDALTLGQAKAYTDERFDASIRHTNTEVAEEADARALLGGALWAKITEIIDKLLPGLGAMIEKVESLLSQKIGQVASNLQTTIDNVVTTFNDTIKGIQDWLDWLWCNFFSDDC